MRFSGSKFDHELFGPSDDSDRNRFIRGSFGQIAMQVVDGSQDLFIDLYEDVVLSESGRFSRAVRFNRDNFHRLGFGQSMEAHQAAAQWPSAASHSKETTAHATVGQQ